MAIISTRALMLTWLWVGDARRNGREELTTASEPSRLAKLLLADRPSGFSPHSPMKFASGHAAASRSRAVRLQDKQSQNPGWKPMTDEERADAAGGAATNDEGPPAWLPDFIKDLIPVDTENMSPRGVVVTGGANGVGFAYADSFMKRGHSVVICDIQDPAAAVAALQQRHQGSSAKVYGCVCDVSDATSVENLGQFAKDNLGTIHYWINNAGINGGRRPFTTLSTGTVEAVVKVNLIGVLLCTKVALDIMQQQAGVTSHVFNTVGSGVKGGGTPGYVSYGATKRGLPQLTASLVAELDKGVPGFEVPPPAGTVNVHTISPGMVFTKLLLDDSTPELRKFPFGVLAAQPEEVGEDLVPKILATRGNGNLVEFLDTARVLRKFKEKFLDGKKSEYIDDDGNVIKTPGAQYDDIGVRKLY